jgi:hypothetical protein
MLGNILVTTDGINIMSPIIIPTFLVYITNMMSVYLTSVILTSDILLLLFQNKTMYLKKFYTYSHKFPLQIHNCK